MGELESRAALASSYLSPNNFKGLQGISQFHEQPNQVREAGCQEYALGSDSGNAGTRVSIVFTIDHFNVGSQRMM